LIERAHSDQKADHGGLIWIFIVVNHFSKYIFLKAMKEATASNVVNFLVNEVFYKFGVPEKSCIQGV